MLQKTRDFWTSVLQRCPSLGGSKDTGLAAWDTKQAQGEKEQALTVLAASHLTETPGGSGTPSFKVIESRSRAEERWIQWQTPTTPMGLTQTSKDAMLESRQGYCSGHSPLLGILTQLPRVLPEPPGDRLTTSRVSLLKTKITSLGDFGSHTACSPPLIPASSLGIRALAAGSHCETTHPQRTTQPTSAS